MKKELDATDSFDLEEVSVNDVRLKLESNPTQMKIDKKQFKREWAVHDGDKENSSVWNNR